MKGNQDAMSGVIRNVIGLGVLYIRMAIGGGTPQRENDTNAVYHYLIPPSSSLHCQTILSTTDINCITEPVVALASTIASHDGRASTLPAPLYFQSRMLQNFGAQIVYNVA